MTKRRHSPEEAGLSYQGGAVRIVGEDAPAQHDPTLTEALAAAGFTHRKPNRPGVAPSAQDIIDASGNIVATLRSHEAWEWLRARSAKATAKP